MYQFSLDAYISLFNLSLEKSQKSPKLEERIDKLNEYHTFAVYRFVNLLFVLFNPKLHLVLSTNQN